MLPYRVSEAADPTTPLCQNRSGWLAERVTTGAVCTAEVFALMLLISIPLRTVQELMAPLSATHDIRLPVMLVPITVLVFAAARSKNTFAILGSLILLVVVLLIALIPRAWLYPAMLLAAALLVSTFLCLKACISAYLSASVPAPNISEQHAGLMSLAELKVANCPLISFLPENFSFPALHTLTLHSLGKLNVLRDLSRLFSAAGRMHLVGDSCTATIETSQKSVATGFLVDAEG
ncbi:unnamed protein product [Closterium sp. NIES-64]|nr:unnamed protein product [Closterium sp. NIES-64]CAI5987349.1 unnamed protein product [Closterium sp. NIES-65]